jgi:hypothetical protein
MTRKLDLIAASSLISKLYKSLLQTLSLLQPAVFTSRFLVTASNSGDSSASALTPFLAGDRLTTELSSQLIPLITHRQGPRRKHSSSIVVETCLPCCCVVTVAARTTENTALLLFFGYFCGRYLTTAAVYRVTA